MDVLQDPRRRGVWVAREGASLPANLKNLTGLVVVFQASKQFERHLVYRGEAIILSPVRGNIVKTTVRIKFAFLPNSKNSSSSFTIGPLDAQPFRDWMSIEEFQKEYCPLVIFLGNRRSYIEVFDKLSLSDGRQVLLAANDIAALNEFRPTSRLLQEVRIPDHNLWSEFLLEDEERFSLIAFSRLLPSTSARRLSLGNLDALHTTVPLWDGRFDLQIRLNFPRVLGQRQLQNVVIGPNGSGKTNLLLGLTKCVVKGRFTRIEKGEVVQDAWSDSPVHVAVFTYEPALWTRFRDKNLEIHRQGVQANNWRQLTQVIYDLGAQEEGPIDLRLLVEILSNFIDVRAMYFKLHPRDSSRNHWRQQLHDWDNGDNNEVSLTDLTQTPPDILEDLVSRLDRRGAPFMRSLEGRIYELSSGERSLALFCAKLMKAARRSALVLVDEPENHLHPKFISLMIQTLSRVLLATESRALLVTHSPFVVREFERSTVKVLKRTVDGVPELFRPAMQTLGGDVSMISDYVFEDEDITKGFELSIDRALRSTDFDDGSVDRRAWAEQVAGELGEDAMSYLLAKDAFVERSSDA